MIRFTCACGRQLQSREEHAGREAVCPDCGRRQVVPAVSEDAVRPDGPAVGRGGGREDVRPDRPALAPEPEEAGLSPVATSGKATASLVLGLLSFLCTFVTGIPAVVCGILALRDISQSRGRLAGQGLAIAGLVTGGLGCMCTLLVLPALLLPAVQRVREAAARVQSANNLKQMAIAMHGYNDANGRLPPAAICDGNGRPLLSWRVAILPYIEQHALYLQFKLDEPWDGPNNRPLLARMPTVYLHPSDAKAQPGQTVYQVFVGPSAPFNKTAGLRLGEVPDGTANTILIVEAAQGVPWTKPEDLDYDPNRPLPALGGHLSGGFNAAAMDGAVHWIPKDTPEQTLRALINPRDGIPVTFPEK